MAAKLQLGPPSFPYCSVCLFVGLYWCVQEEWLSPLTLFVSSLLVTALGFTTVLLMEGSFRLRTSFAGLYFNGTLMKTKAAT